MTNRRPSEAPASHDPLVPTVLPSQLVAEMARRGVDPAPLLATFELPAFFTHKPFVTMPLSSLRAFAEAAARLAGDEHLGLHAGENSRSSVLALLAFACSGVRTGREALEMYVKYASTVHDALKFSLHQEKAGVELRLKIAGHPECLGRHGNEHWIASCLVAAAEVAGMRRVPGAVWLAHRAPAARGETVRVLGTTRVTFDAGHNGILFTNQELDAPVRNTGTPEATALSRYSSRTSVLPPAPTAFISRVREAIEERLPAGAPGMADIARVLGVSGRTLQRRLADEGQTFLQVLDGVRRDIAVVHVERKDLSLEDVAARVGYTQKGALFRSFRRWTGKTPRGREGGGV